MNKINFPLIGIFIIGIFLLWPLHNFQYAIAQGDHGRDLYAFDQVWNGKMPYKDFLWFYGPFMLYYYGLFLKIFGISIKSVLIGKIFCQLLAGIFIFLIGRTIASSLAGYFAAIWFWIFWEDFIYTYNHIGAVTVLMACLFCLFHSNYNKKNNLIPWAFFGIFIIGLIKINFGVVNLILFTFFVRTEKPIKFVYFSLTLVGWFIIYGLFVNGMPTSEIWQCFPYTTGIGNDEGIPPTIIQAIQLWFTKIWADILKNQANWALFGLVILSLGRLIYQKIYSDKKFITTLFILVIFYCTNLHEFIKSGVPYRTAWAQPIAFIIVFYVIDYAWHQGNKTFYKIISIIIASILIYNAYITIHKINAFKIQSHYLSLPRGQVYSSQETNHWIGSITIITDFLNTKLGPNELFLALPYDNIYYFLTGKPSPTRQLVFFEFAKISLAQEIKILKELDTNHVNYIVLSNFYQTDDHYRGTFGESYCPLIAAYLRDNFEPIAQLGEWNSTPGWADHHGVTIFKKKI